jgi:WD40 repeat protein
VSDQPEHPYGLFISYAKADRAWVEGFLLDALDQAGLRYISEEAFALGVPRLHEFERAVRESSRTLLIVSAAYLAEGFTQFADLLAQTYGLETGTWPVIPLILEKVELPPRLALLVGLDASDPAQWRQVVERLCETLQHPAPAPPAKPPCPYPGIVPFAEEDASRFFGRDCEVQELLERLRTQRFVAVIGPSGCGKSSLVHAGLVPALRKSGLFGPGAWIVKTMRPGDDPLATLQKNLAELPAYTPALLEGRTGESDSPLPCEGRGAGEVRSSDRMLLIVDQLEELFTHKAKDAPAFEQALLDLAGRPDFYIVLTARADFYADLMRSALWPAIQAHRYETPPLDADGLRQAIVRPAEDVGVYVEAALVERLVADATGGPGVLPFVQETLKLLWERLERRYLPLSAYEALILTRRAYGRAPATGLQIAMASWADAVLGDLSPGRQAIARRVFLRLVQFGEGRADTRRQQPVSALRCAGDQAEEFEETLKALAAGRLIVLSGEAADPGRRADLAHDALITGWPALQGWVTERREAELTRRRLEAKAAEWVRLGGKSGGLLDAIELREAEQWLAGPDATDLGYSASLADLAITSRRALRRAFLLRVISLTVAVLAVIAVVAMYAIWQRSAAQREGTLRRQVEVQLALSRSRQVAAVARNRLDAAEAQQALLLAVAANRQITETVEAANVLREALGDWRGEAILAGHNRRVCRVAFSPNGQYLATISNDDTAAIWQLAGERKVLTLTGHTGDLTHLVFSRDSRLLVTASRDKTARVWEVEAGRPVHVLRHGDDVVALAISPDGQTVATGGQDNAVRLWDLATGQPARGEPFRAEGAILDLAFSPDGILLVAASADNTVWLWHLPSGQFARLTGFSAVVNGIAFSPDGRYLAAIGGDLLQAWDMNGLKPIPLKQAQHAAAILSLAFSPDGYLLATAGQDALVKLWDLRRPDADPLVLRGHTEAVSGLAFSPDGQLLATTSWDETARLWRPDGGAAEAVLVGHGGELWLPAFSPDGQLLATPDERGIVRLWRTQAGGDLAGHTPRVRPITALAVAEGQAAVAGDDGAVELWQPGISATQVYTVGAARLTAMAFSSDGALLAAGGADGQVAVLDAGRGTRVAAWPAHIGATRALLFLPDGIHLASAGADAVIRLWDLRRLGTGQPARELTGHANDVTALAAGADPATLVSASGDGTGRIWNWQTGQQRGVFAAGNPLLAVALSPDGRRLATGGYGAAALIWDVAQPAARPISLTHPATVRALAFSPNGRYLATAAEDGWLRVWDLAGGETGGPILLRGHAGQWVVSLVYSRDGETLTSAGGDGQVRVWPATTAGALTLACRRVGRDFSAEEWRTYLPFLAPGRLCPAAEAVAWQPGDRLDPPRPAPAAALGPADPRPVIRYFEAIPGSTIAAGGRLTLRWDVSAAAAVYLEAGGVRRGVTAPRQEVVAATADTVYRLIAVNAAGERSAAIAVMVR